MATVSLICVNCSQHYVLGRDAMVVSGLNFLDKLMSVDILGGTSSGFMNNPDLINRCILAALSIEDKRKQQKIISMIKKGQRSQWTCKKCNATQSY